MSTLTERELIELVVGWVRQNGLKSDLAGLEVSADTDLMSSGLLDSFMDLTDAEPSEFSVVKGLCRIALKDHQ